LIFKCSMSYGTMNKTMKTHVCYFVLMVYFLHYLYLLHADFYITFFNNGPNILKLIAWVRYFFWVWWGFGSIGEKWFVCVQLFFGL